MKKYFSKLYNEPLSSFPQKMPGDEILMIK